MGNKVIAKEYVDKNYLEKDIVRKYLDSKIDELRNIHNNSKDNVERAIAKGMAVFTTMMKKELLEDK